MKILIATGSFYPCRDANAICVKGIASEFVEQGNEVTVLCYRQDSIDMPSEIDGIRLKSILPDAAIRMLSFSRGSQSLVACVARTIGSVARKMKRFIFLPWSPMTSPLFSYRYYKVLANTYYQGKYDLVVSVFLPFEPSVAAYWLKKKDRNCSWCLYALDSFENERIPSAIREHCTGHRWIKRFLDCSDGFLIMKSRLSWFSEHGYKDRLEDIIVSDIPLLGKNSPSRNLNKGHAQMSRDSIWVYAGTFSPPYYRHEDLFAIFLSLYRSGEAGVLDIYTDQLSQQTLSRAIKSAGEAVVCHDVVPHEKLIDILQDADILVSVKYKAEISAKVFEYFETGHPVLHVSGCSEDPCAEYVEAYPFGCVVYPYREDLAHMIEKVQLWLEDGCGRNAYRHGAAKREIADIFKMNDPVYTCRLMLDVVNA